MKNKYRFSFLLNSRLGLVFLLVFAYQVNGQTNTNSLNLNDAVTRVLENNPNLAASQANLEATKSNIAIARGSALPALNLGGTVSQSKYATISESSGVIPSSSAVVGGSLSQMIYNEKYLANLKIQKYLYASEEEQFKSAQYNVIATTGIAYVDLLLAKDVLAVQKENLQITQKNLQGAKDRFAEGNTDKKEVLRWETQMYADLQAIESKKAAVIIRQGGLNQLFNMPLETKEELLKLSIDSDGFLFSSKLVSAKVAEDNGALIIRDYLVALGIANSPVLASIDQQLNAQNRQWQSNKRWALPSLTASAGANAIYDIDNQGPKETESTDKSYWKYGVSMYWPIINGGSNINKAKQSKWQVSALELQKNDIQNSLEQAIRSSAAVVISDYINVSLSKKQAAAAVQNYELVNDAYLAGNSSLLDLLDAQNQRLNAETATKVSFYTFMGDLFTLEQAIGYFPFMDSKENVDKIIHELEVKLF